MPPSKRIRQGLIAVLFATQVIAAQTPQPQTTAAPTRRFDYLWYEAENMRGIGTDPRNEPRVYPSHVLHTREKSPGWGINGPGVSAEWSQGGESEWNSAAASPDEVKATLSQDVEIPREGQYKVWARYADWGGKSEHFTVRVWQEGREVFRHEFGGRDHLDPRDEIVSYWGWAFAWGGATTPPLKKGPARVTIDIERAADARRHVDCFLLTNDPAFVPEGRRKPQFAAMMVLNEWAAKRFAVAPLVEAGGSADEVPPSWRRSPIAGRDFLMPWNISEKFWELYDSAPPNERPLYPFHSEAADLFVQTFKGARDVPIFSSKLVAPVVYINELPKHLKEGSPFLRYLRETKSPFAVLINYGNAQMPEADAQAAWKLLTGELRNQFLGWISGESIGYVYTEVAKSMTLAPTMSRAEMLEKSRLAYTDALSQKWAGMFHTQTGPAWEMLVPAQSTSSTTFSHALARWGVRLVGLETAAVQPNFAMRLAFTRGAARQYGANFLYYHAPNFGDTATTFTKQQNFAGPDHFFHSRYGMTMGPSLAWYRKSYYFYYMGGASAIYLEQGFDQFFKPAPGEHPFQLNPLGRITDEFMRFAEKHPDRGVPYTPVAFLLDPAHGFEPTDWPHWPFGVSQIDRGDRALRELFSAAYHPAAETEGEPATADRQSYVNGIFGDIFDVLVASDERRDALDSYRTAIVGGRVNWTPAWAEKLQSYVRRGGTVLINSAQSKGLPENFLGVRLLGPTSEADAVVCASPGETHSDLSGNAFRYERVEPRGAEVLLRTTAGEPVVTVNRSGQGRVVFVAVPDLLGLDERMTAAAAHALIHLLSEATPVRVRGDVQYMLNRNSRGWVVTLFNNRGVYKPQQGLAHVERGEVAEVSIDLRGKGVERAEEWTTGSQLTPAREAQVEAVRVQIPAGGVRVVELVPRR